MHLLISSFIGLKTLQHHIQTISMNLLSEATTASKCTIILVNPNESDQFKSIIELKSSINGNQNRLGLIEDNGTKHVLHELGVKEGSHLLIINNINYCI